MMTKLKNQFQMTARRREFRHHSLSMIIMSHFKMKQRLLERKKEGNKLWKQRKRNKKGIMKRFSAKSQP